MDEHEAQDDDPRQEGHGSSTDQKDDVFGDHHSLRSAREGARHEKLGPSGDEAGDGAESLPRVNVLTAGLWERGRHLCEENRAHTGDDAPQNPNAENLPGISQVASDEPGCAQYAGADDDPHCHGETLPHAQNTVQTGMGAWAGFYIRGRHCLPVER